MQKPRKKGVSVPRKRDPMQPTRRWNPGARERERALERQSQATGRALGGKASKTSVRASNRPGARSRKRGRDRGEPVHGLARESRAGRLAEPRRVRGIRSTDLLRQGGKRECGGPSTGLTTRFGSSSIPRDVRELGSGGGTSPVPRHRWEKTILTDCGQASCPVALQLRLVGSRWESTQRQGGSSCGDAVVRCRRGDSSRGVGIARSSSGLEQAAVVGRWSLREPSGGQRRTRHGPRTALSERRRSHRVSEPPAEEVGPNRFRQASASSRLRPDAMSNGKRTAQRQPRLRTEPVAEWSAGVKCDEPQEGDRDATSPERDARLKSPRHGLGHAARIRPRAWLARRRSATATHLRMPAAGAEEVLGPSV